MNCARAFAHFSFPWNRAAERVVDFENAGGVPKFFKAMAINFGQSFTGDADKLPDRYVEQHSARLWQIIQTFYTMVDVDLAPKFAQIIRQCIRDCLGTAAWNRPTHRVSGDSEHKSKRG